MGARCATWTRWPIPRRSNSTATGRSSRRDARSSANSASGEERATMNFIAIVVALALEQWRAFQWRAGVERAFVRFARYLEGAMNGGTRQQGAIATLLALAPPVAITALIHFALVAVHPMLALLWSIAVLYLLMGFRRFSHAVSSIVLALKAGELPSARRTVEHRTRGTGQDDEPEHHREHLPVRVDQAALDRKPRDFFGRQLGGDAATPCGQRAPR